MKTISLKIPASLDLALLESSKLHNLSKSELIRLALEEKLIKKSMKGRSVLDLTADLAGSVKGPGDLSTNKKYLDDMGK